MDPPAAAVHPVGGTPRDLIEGQGTAALYRYRPLAGELYCVPLLLVLPPTNRGYVFDLAPGRSLVVFLLARGYDVYMLDWRSPGIDEAGRGLDAYVELVADTAARVRADSGEGAVSLLGYCMGGVLAALHAAHGGVGVRALVALATPADFSHFDYWRGLTDAAGFDIDALVAGVGIVPSDWLYAAFDGLNPAARLAGTVRLWDRRDDDGAIAAFRRLARWSGDVLPLPGAFLRDIVAAAGGTRRFGRRQRDRPPRRPCRDCRRGRCRPPALAAARRVDRPALDLMLLR